MMTPSRNDVRLPYDIASSKALRKAILPKLSQIVKISRQGRIARCFSFNLPWCLPSIHAAPLQWSHLHATRGRGPSTHGYTDRKFRPFTSKEGFFPEEQMSIFP